MTGDLAERLKDLHNDTQRLAAKILQLKNLTAVDGDEARRNALAFAAEAAAVARDAALLCARLEASSPVRQARAA